MNYKKQEIENVISEFKKALETKGITIYRLSKISGIPRNNIYSALNPNKGSMPTMKTILRLCQSAEVTISFNTE